MEAEPMQARTRWEERRIHQSTMVQFGCGLDLGLPDFRLAKVNKIEPQPLPGAALAGAKSGPEHTRTPTMLAPNPSASCLFPSNMPILRQVAARVQHPSPTLHPPALCLAAPTPSQLRGKGVGSPAASFSEQPTTTTGVIDARGRIPCLPHAMGAGLLRGKGVWVCCGLVLRAAHTNHWR